MEDLGTRVPDEHHDHLIDVRNGVIEFQNDAIEEL